MQDFIGKEIKAGGWLAAGGSGNSQAEYGMILYYVEEVLAVSLKLVRLKVNYPQHTTESATVHVRRVTVHEPNRYCVVTPSAKVRGLFNRALNGKLRPGEAQTIGAWVHGSLDTSEVF